MSSQKEPLPQAGNAGEVPSRDTHSTRLGYITPSKKHKRKKSKDPVGSLGGSGEESFIPSAAGHNVSATTASNSLVRPGLSTTTSISTPLEVGSNNAISKGTISSMPISQLPCCMFLVMSPSLCTTSGFCAIPPVLPCIKQSSCAM